MSTEVASRIGGELPEFEAAIAKLLPDDAPDGLRRFARVWLQARPRGGLPRFADIDPRDMADLLPYLFTAGRNSSGRFVYRIVGEEMDNRLGSHLKGKTAWDVFATDYAELVDARWRRIADTPSACYTYSRHVTLGGRLLLARRLLLPLGEPDGRIMGVSHFDQEGPSVEPFSGGGEELTLHWTPIGELPYA